MSLFDDYSFEVKKVYEKNPIIKLQELFGKELDVEPAELISLIIAIRKSWESYKEFNVQCGIIVETNTEDTSNIQIRGYDFTADLRMVIQSASHKSIIYKLNTKGQVIDVQFTKEKISYDDLVDISRGQRKIIAYLGIKGIDILINGVAFENENRLENYSDVINFKKLADISQYQELLKKFFLERVQYDPFKSFFVYKGDIERERYPLLEKHPKLLQIKPEERFQRELEYFLKNNCLDEVKTEMRNRFGERYDVWIATSDDKFYVFEIKWLGKSMTAQGNVFDEYNDPERALEGAYQLKKYIDDAEEYGRIINGEFRIYCGVLVIYDARESMDNLVYPEEFNRYPQLDLNQQFKIERGNIPASQYYSKVVKKAE
ncbi:hypothetical protein [Paenibacillus tyrfis]|uniref:hypothetical protein n=1 Tax=Paenibacillus tyrfis TaxID=1501230 RepID=UPI00209E8CB0|nr:hypothetical protein [Paenibacillus tyrfis]MCP1312590.1 hypothetical protein [Paenibacillus tyrfis]